MMEQQILSWLNAFSQVAIGIGVLYGLWRMIQITREARAARAQATVASERAEAAAKQAAIGIVDMAVDLKELAVNTNSIKDALVAAEKGKSRLEGMEEQRAKTDAKGASA